MLELYLLSRLNVIIAILIIISFISGVFVILGGIFKLIVDPDDGLEDMKDDMPFIYGLIKKLKLNVIILVISILGVITIPNKKDAYIIYGGGTVIDYIKEDTTAKQIPHKAIVAIDKYLDSLEEDKKDKDDQYERN